MTQNHGSSQKFILKRDVRMPNLAPFGVRAGTVVPAGTVFYKAAGGYRPWFHAGPEGLALDEHDFIAEQAEDCSGQQATMNQEARQAERPAG